MAWRFTWRREEAKRYTRLDGRAEEAERGQMQYWCFIIGATWCSLDIWPLWPETYGLHERFSSLLGTPSSGPHHRPVAADLMDGLDEGPVLATLWSFPAEDRARLLADVEAMISGE